MPHQFVIPFSQLSMKNIASVGGKNAALGEMFNKVPGMRKRVPDGFSITADAFDAFMKANRIASQVRALLKSADRDDVTSLSHVSHAIHSLIVNAMIPADLEKLIRHQYRLLSRKYKSENIDVAVRSSATAEDLPGASFAGQLESFLNIHGEAALFRSIKECFASLYSERAIAYALDQKLKPWLIRVAVVVQKMVRSDKGCAGVMFTVDPETGFQKVIVINGSWGLGENVVKGRVNPDEFVVYTETLTKKFRPIVKRSLGRKQLTMIYDESKPSFTRNNPTARVKREQWILTDDEVLLLAKQGRAIANHYKKPMDIEWAKDGIDGQLYIVQARPETVHGLTAKQSYQEFSLQKKGKVIASGVSVGKLIGQGKARVIMSTRDMVAFKPGEVLITRMTDPAWEPIMKTAGAIVTEAGGRTCHAAIVSRELGIPCVVGAKDATKLIATGDDVTVDGASAEVGVVYKGLVPFKVKRYDLTSMKTPKNVEVKLNIGNPGIAFQSSFLPNDGVGLARLEFIIAESIKIHPMALIHFEKLPQAIRRKVASLTNGYADKKEYYVSKLAEGIGQIAAAFYPKEVLVRFSDFKTNEYRALVGGSLYEPHEENPMLGWRGSSRYYDPQFEPAFALECAAVKRVREQFGLTNVAVMFPFTRTTEEVKKVLAVMKENNLPRQKNLRVFVMCELPVNVLQAKEFLSLVDGYSIGSNDLTQLVMGVDRDSTLVRHLYDERHPAVLQVIKRVVQEAHALKKDIGFCGQAPSDYPELGKSLVKWGITSMSVTPDAVIPLLKVLRRS